LTTVLTSVTGFLFPFTHITRATASTWWESGAGFTWLRR
jgi:hypothetical protein